MIPKLTLDVPTAPYHLAPQAGQQDDWPTFAQAYLDTLNQQAAQQFPQLEIQVRKTPGHITSVRQNGRGEVDWETLDAVLDWVENDRGQHLEAAAKTRSATHHQLTATA